MSEAVKEQNPIDINTCIPPEDNRILIGELGCVIMSVNALRTLVSDTGNAKMIAAVEKAIRAMQDRENSKVTEEESE